CAAQKRGPLGSECRFRLLNIRAGTYGVIRGARSFLAGAVRRSETSMPDFAYLFEKIILRATDLELGTCWLGGPFNRSEFAGRMGLAEDEILPAASPVGYSPARRSNLDRIIHKFAGAKNRKDWQDLFFDNDFAHPLGRKEAGDFSACLEMVRLAPSASNRQPWRIIKERNKNVFHFFLLRTRGYRMLTRIDLQRLDMGIAMCHFELTAETLNIAGGWLKSRPVRPSLVKTAGRAEYVVSWAEKE
ncbi:unnamed protein product, partial [marine sediment metagenome]